MHRYGSEMNVKTIFHKTSIFVFPIWLYVKFVAKYIVNIPTNGHTRTVLIALYLKVFT